MVILDLQNVFDTVKHTILLAKLRAFGFNNSSLQWVQSYLEGREQVVVVPLLEPSPYRGGEVCVSL